MLNIISYCLLCWRLRHTWWRSGVNNLSVSKSYTTSTTTSELGPHIHIYTSTTTLSYNILRRLCWQSAEYMHQILTCVEVTIPPDIQRWTSMLLDNIDFSIRHRHQISAADGQSRHQPQHRHRPFRSKLSSVHKVIRMYSVQCCYLP